MAAFFDVKNISFAHPLPGGKPHPALFDVSFEIKAGEHVAIVGANGSGKTTLARHLNALHIPDQGEILVQGLSTSDKKNHLVIHQKVGMVFQHPPEQMIATTIAEDVAFGPENLGLTTAEIQNRVQESLEKVDLWEIRDRSPDRLSAGQMQRVALAGILAMQPSCIIFDEATAMLDPEGRKEVHSSIQTLKSQGITIITISHFMEEVVYADRILALQRGKLAYDGKPRELFEDDDLLQSLGLKKPRTLMIAEQLKKWIPTIETPLTLEAFEEQIQKSPPGKLIKKKGTKFGGEEEQPIIKIKNLSFTYQEGTPFAHKALIDIDLEINQKQIVGLIGATGSGKSTLLQHINGLYLPQEGQVSVGKFNLHKETDLKALRRFVGIVFQNPGYQLFEQYVGDEIAYGLRLLGFSGTELRQRVQKAMNTVGLDFEQFKDRMTFTLSGGEMRKVALASSLALEPGIMLLDEPTAGLDPAAREEILKNIVAFNQSGQTIIISSHQMEDLALVADKVSLLSEGNVKLSGEAKQVLSRKQELENYHMQPPIAALMADILRNQGWNLPDGIITSYQLIAAFENQEQ